MSCHPKVGKAGKIVDEGKRIRFKQIAVDYSGSQPVLYAVTEDGRLLMRRLVQGNAPHLTVTVWAEVPLFECELAG